MSRDSHPGLSGIRVHMASALPGCPNYARDLKPMVLESGKETVHLIVIQTPERQER